MIGYWTEYPETIEVLRHSTVLYPVIPLVHPAERQVAHPAIIDSVRCRDDTLKLAKHYGVRRVGVMARPYPGYGDFEPDYLMDRQCWIDALNMAFSIKNRRGSFGADVQIETWLDGEPYGKEDGVGKALSERYANDPAACERVLKAASGKRRRFDYAVPCGWMDNPARGMAWYQPALRAISKRAITEAYGIRYVETFRNDAYQLVVDDVAGNTAVTITSLSAANLALVTYPPCKLLYSSKPSIAYRLRELLG